MNFGEIKKIAVLLKMMLDNVISKQMNRLIMLRRFLQGFLKVIWNGVKVKN